MLKKNCLQSLKRHNKLFANAICIHLFEKTCLVKIINDELCDTMELWEGDRDKFVPGFRFLTFKLFSFQDNFKSKLRHAVLL